MKLPHDQRVLFAMHHPQLGEIAGEATVQHDCGRRVRLRLGASVFTVPADQVFGPGTIAYEFAQQRERERES